MTIAVALTNSASAAVESQLESAGLTQLFDHIVSVEVVRSYKPSAAPYLYVAELLETTPAESLMVACHDWDLAGARATGYQTAFVQRPAMAYANRYPAPEYLVADFAELAQALTE